MTVRQIVGSILSVLGSLASLLYLLEYLGIRLTALFLPANAFYLGIAVLGAIVCLGYLGYELLCLVRTYDQRFMAEIFGEPENKFLVGGTLCFKAQYRGNLKHGFFTSKVRPEELNTILDTGRDYEWLVDYNTHRHIVDTLNNTHWDTGELNGGGTGWLRKAHRSTWGIRFRSSIHPANTL